MLNRRRWTALVLGVVAFVAVMRSRDAQAQCVDEELKNELVGGRHYRGVQERLFTKAFRHELSAMGGWFAADLFSSTWTVSGAYTFHFSEDLGLEASFAYTRFRSTVTDIFDARNPNSQLLANPDAPGRLYFGHLIWSFAYGKLRWAGGPTTRFDFNAAIGGGVTDNGTAQGLTGSFGFGTKWYIGKWFAVRLDVRDHILRENILGQDSLVNDIFVTGGFSVFIPFSG